MAEERIPSEEELREALDRIAVADILLSALSTTASIGFHRVSPEARDLDQARANLQLAYASAIAGAADASSDEEPSAEPDAT